MLKIEIIVFLHLIVIKLTIQVITHQLHYNDALDIAATLYPLCDMVGSQSPYHR